jgi:hypothetical protein
MVVTPGGIVMLVKPMQPRNAPMPMLVTLEGIVMLVRPIQPLNAASPMLVTGFPTIDKGMLTSPTSVVG